MKLLSVAVVTLAAATAFAAKSNTEYFYQPAGGQQAVELRYQMNSKPGKIEANGTGVESDAKQQTSDFLVEYWYGLSEGNAIGIHTFFGSNKYSFGGTDHTASGMGDIFLGYKGFTDMWHYGVDLGINTGKQKFDNASNLPDNRSTGGLSLAPYVGVLMSSDALNYGAKLTYAYAFERSADDTAGTKRTGGADLILAPYIEYNYGMGFVGAELAYHMVGDTTAKAGGTEVKEKGESFPMINLNGSYDFNDMVTGLLNIGFGMHPEHDVDDSATPDKAKAYTETNFNLGVRLTF